MSEPENPQSRSATFTRRKFTIPEKTDQRLKQLADQHYQGNVSLCIRAAIEDHESTLTENNALELHRMEQQIISLATEIQSLSESLPEISESPNESDCQQGMRSFGTGDSTLERVTDEVLEEFEVAQSSLRLEDCMDRLDTQPELIVSAFERLLDLGYIHEIDQSSRYRLTSLRRNDVV